MIHINAGVRLVPHNVFHQRFVLASLSAKTKREGFSVGPRCVSILPDGNNRLEVQVFKQGAVTMAIIRSFSDAS